MRQSFIRFDTAPFKKALEKAQQEVKAEKFKPDLLNYTRVVLNTCVKTTPVRSLSLIQTAQRKQYANRINYIPSIHTLVDPTLIIKPDRMWLFCGGKWYDPNLFQLPPDVWSIFETLLAEHLRRMETPQDDFVKERAQARYLYQLSWVQCGQSIGLKIIASSSVLSSHTRRKPPKNPPRGYAQIRGGETVISVVIYNPFSQSQSQYKNWDGSQILNAALLKHRPAFLARVKKHLERIVYAITH